MNMMLKSSTIKILTSLGAAGLLLWGAADVQAEESSVRSILAEFRNDVALLDVINETCDSQYSAVTQAMYDDMLDILYSGNVKKLKQDPIYREAHMRYSLLVNKAIADGTQTLDEGCTWLILKSGGMLERYS